MVAFLASPLSSFHACLPPIQAATGKQRKSNVNKKPDISIPVDAGKIQDNIKFRNAERTELLPNTGVENNELLPETNVKNSQRKDNSLDPIDSSVSITREDILQASITTCTAISVSGVGIQQATHWASESGWSVPDCTHLLAYNIEIWHLGILFGLVGSVSIARQILIQAWPEFSESSDVANQQVLGPLRLGDYIVAAVLPGLSEEVLFRGALLPLFGLDWKGVAISGVIFGLLHLTGGRKAAFAIWASVVGILYGVGCVATHSVLIPMIAHSANNLIGALLWKLKQEDLKIMD